MADIERAEFLSALASLDRSAAELLARDARSLVIDDGTLVFEPGQACERYILIERGSVRVHLLDPNGHEIVLYRLGAGDTCVLTTAALLGQEPYAAYAVAETKTVATIVPAQVFDDLLARSAGFRRFVFAAHAERLVALMGVIADVAFARVQTRLARWLLAHADANGRVEKTHEAIAVELGTAREVVSRNLKSLERMGCVALGHGRVEIAKLGGLGRLAGKR